MAYWLMKSEPNDYAWDDLVRDGRATWDGVHNHTAARNMRAMAVGDRVFGAFLLHEAEDAIQDHDGQNDDRFVRDGRVPVEDPGDE